MINNDDLVEADENFNVVLSNVTPNDVNIDPADIDDADVGTVTINNDDIDLTLSAAMPTSQNEGNPGDTTQYTFTVTRTGLMTGTTTVDWSVAAASGSAVTGDDFEGGAFPSGSLTFLNGEMTKTITIDIAEDTTVEPDEDFVLSLSNPAHVEDSGEVPVDDTYGVQIVDNDQTATIVNDDMAMFDVIDTDVDEDAGTVTVTVQLNGAVQGGLSVDYATVAGTADDPADYTGTSGTLSFPTGADGETATFMVMINNDDLVEADETFNVVLSNVTPNDVNIDPADIDDADVGTVTINNDDIDLTLSAAMPTSQNEGNPGDTTQYTFTVTRTGLMTGTTTVDWSVAAASGSAVTGDDFEGGAFPSGSLTFLNGEMTKTITIDIAEDTTVEPDEDFVLSLSNPAHVEDSGEVPVDDTYGVQIVDNDQTATIVDDDCAKVVVGEASVYETSSNFVLQIPVTLDVGVQGGFTVDFSITDITATLGDDYTVLTNSPLSFDGNPGEVEFIEIQINGDSDVEMDESFQIILSNAVPNDSNIDPAAIKLNEGGTAATSSVTLLIDGSTFNEVPPPTNTGPLVVNSTTDDPALLINELLGTGINVVGTPTFIGAPNSGGFFTGGSTSIGIESGLLISTGDAALANGPNNSDGTTSTGSGIPDADIANEFGVNSTSATVLEFDFETVGGDLFFDFVFASEEYNEFVNSAFNDAFAFFLDGTNIALIPGTNDPIMIDTVNLNVNSQFYNNNDPSDGGAFLTEIEYDGFTDVFTAQALDLTPGVHTIKLVVSNVGDQQLDSAVFFRANSFSGSPADQFVLTNTSTDPGSQVDQVILDISSLGLQFDTNVGSDNGTDGMAFTPTFGSDADTGLIPVTVNDNATSITLDFSDFDPGENLTWQIDVDTIGLDDVITGDQLIGLAGSVVFSNGLTASGTLQAVPGNPDAAMFVLEAGQSSGNSGLVTILNDDIDLELMPTDTPTQNEGDSGATTYTFEVTRDGFITGSSADTTVDWAVSGLGNLNADDFVGGVLPSGTLVFGPTETSKLIEIQVQGDLLVEADEIFTVTLSNPVNLDPNLDTLEINNDTESATILNDDTALLVIDDVLVQETQSGFTTATFTISTVDGMVADEDITVDYVTMDGTAIAGEDYIMTSGTATILEGTSATTVTVMVIGDKDVELDETFKVILSEPTYNGDPGDADPNTGGPGADGDPSTGVQQVEILDGEGIGTINNDDAVVEFVLPQSSQSEGGVGTGPELFIRGDLTDVPVDQRFVTLQIVGGGTAIRGVDYNFGDDLLDPVQFVVPAEDYSNGMAFDLTLFDQNGELASVSGLDPVLQILEDNLIEGRESLNVEIQGQGNVFEVAEAVVPPGGTDPNGVNNDTTHIIEDNDFATITVTPTNVDEEGGAQEFSVVMTTTDGNGGTAILAPGVSITADVENFLANGTASASDFSYSTQDVTFNPGEGDGETRFLTITPTSDDIVEANETVNFDFTNTNAGIGGIANTQVSFVGGDVTIIDDDGAQVSLTVSSASVNEGDGTISIDVTVDNAVQGGFVVDYQLLDGSANGLGVDFGSNAGSTGQVSFLGNAGETQTITIAINDDMTVEGLEDFSLMLTGATPNMGLPNSVNVNPAADTATISIIDNDGEATVSADVTTVDEATGMATVTLTLDKDYQGGLTVDYATADNTANAGSDYDATTGMATFAGTAGETVTFMVPITDDMVVEGTESLDILLSNATPLASPAGPIATANGSIAITDNDGEATVSADVTSVDESIGMATVTLTLDKDYQGGLTVDYATADNSANAGSDYDAVSGTATFAGTAGETVTFMVPITEDMVVEGTESLDILLSNATPLASPAGPIATANGSVSITDNDGEATVTADVTSVDESTGMATVTLTLDSDYQGGLTVDYATGDNTANAGSDYVAVTGTATFAGTAGETMTFMVPITEDMVVEGTESLDILLSNASPVSSPAGPIATVNGSISITDNDGEATVTADVTSVNEGTGMATVTLTLDKDYQGGLTVDYATADDTANAGSDYDATTGMATFAGTAGETVTFMVPITDDMIVEGTESLNILLSNAAPLASPAGPIATVDGSISITDNDSATVTLISNGPATISEPSGVASYTLKLNGADSSSTDTVVDFSTAGTALREANASFAHLVQDYAIWADDGQGNFFEVTDNQFTIPAGQMSINIEIRVVDDVVVELTENVELTLDGMAGDPVAAGDPDITLGSDLSGNTDIEDNDEAQIIIKSVDPDAAETLPGEATDKGRFDIRVIVPGSVDANNPNGIPAPLSFDLDVGYFISTNSAINSDDYDSIDGEIGFQPGQTLAVIDITPEDDSLVEGDETVTLLLNPIDVSSNTPNAPLADVMIVQGDCDSATVTIHDNDNAMISGIFVSGSGWDSAFANGLGSANGYELTGRSNQLETLPWTNIDTITVEFDNPIDASSIDLADFDLMGTAGYNGDFSLGNIPGILSVAAGSGGNSVVLTLNGFLEPASLDLHVLASGLDTPGTMSNVPGVDANYEFLSLAGDTDQGASSQFVVNAADVTDVTARQGSSIGDSNYSFFADVDGDGTIGQSDLDAVVDRQNSLVVPDFTPPFNGDGEDKTVSTRGDSAPKFSLSGDRKLDLSGAVTLSEKKEIKPSLTPVDQAFESELDFLDDSFGEDLDLRLFAKKK